MPRTRTQRISIGLSKTTLDLVDEIAESFDDPVARGEVVDLAIGYAAEHGFNEWLEENFATGEDPEEESEEEDSEEEEPEGDGDEKEAE